ncbi:MAG: hypothetical protein HFH82_03890 [Lachnospiraceae bacterium]|nr:hypothetical protein [Lachnospiraceae bacterium]
MWIEAVKLFREYMGTGLIVVWFLVSVIYLWVHEKKKYVRVLFLYMPVILLLLYFNPLFAELVFGVAGGEIYYRIIWLLPITIVIAYTCVCIYGDMVRKHNDSARDRTPEGKVKKGLPSIAAVVCLGGLIVISGSFIYDNPFFHKAENLYHVPDSVVHICDAINVPGREVMAVFPLELVQYVRQYSPVTRMPYGREMTVERWNYYNPLCEAMEAEVIDMEVLAPLVKEAECHYVVLPTARKKIGKPEDYGWILFGETDGYEVYREPARELTIPE